MNEENMMQEQDTELMAASEMPEDKEVTPDTTPDTAQEVIQNTEENTYSSKQPKPKNGNGKLIGIIAAVIAVLGIGAVVFAKTMVPVMFPKVFVAEALLTTQKALAKEAAAIEEITGAKLEQQIIASEAMQTGFGLTLRDIKGEGSENIIGMVKGLGLATELKQTAKGDKIYGSLAVNQNELQITKAEFYKSDSEVGLFIPELFDKYLAANLDTFVADYNASALYKMLGTPLDETKYNAFKDYLSKGYREKISPEFISKLGERTAALVKTAEVKYVGKTEVKAGEQNQSYRTYDLVFEDAEVRSYLKDTYKILMEDQNFKDYIRAVDAMSDVAEEEKIGSVLSKSQEEFNKAIDELKALQLTTKLMIDDKNRVAQSIYETKISSNEENIELKLDSALTGSKFMSDASKFVLTLKNGEVQDTVELTSNSNYGSGDSKLTHNLAAVVLAAGEAGIQMNFDMIYDTKAKENNVSVKAGFKLQDEIEYVLDLLSSREVNPSSKTVNMKMSNVTVSIKSPYLNHSLIFDGQYNAQAIKASDIQLQTDNKDYLFKMTEEQLTALSQKIYQGAMQIGSSFLY